MTGAQADARHGSPVALVTGGARRIGAQLCRRLHQQGYSVLLHYRSSGDEARQLVEQLNRQRPDSARLLQAELLDSAQLQRLATTALESWGRLDALINNASAFYPGRVGAVTETHWDELMGSNLKAPFFLCQALAPSLAASQGSIVNLVDIHALKPLKDHPVYSIAKAGLAMLTQSLAKEMAPSVRVNGVAPGVILWPEGEAAIDAANQQQLLARTPLNRPGCPQDIADTVLFLLQQPYITGQILAVDGGKSLYS